MTTVTIYRRALRRRKGPIKGKTQTITCVYETKKRTSTHEQLRKAYPGSKTFEGDNLRVITHFINAPGFELEVPIVSGGQKIAES